jgi:hypothetical protein
MEAKMGSLSPAEVKSGEVKSEARKTDIDRFVNGEGRADLVREVRRKIDTLGVE